MKKTPLLKKVDQGKRLMVYCYYSKAAKLFRSIRIYGSTKKSRTLHQEIFKAAESAKNHDILDVLRVCKEIRNILEID